MIKQDVELVERNKIILMFWDSNSAENVWNKKGCERWAKLKVYVFIMADDRERLSDLQGKSNSSV